MADHRLILVSAGHHPGAPGAGFNGFYEHDEAARWANAVVRHLGPERALRVPNGYLRHKVEFVNSRRALAAVEIHFNSKVVIEDDGTLRHVGDGCETLYYPGSRLGELLAETVQEQISQIFPPNRGIKEGWYRLDPRRGPDFFLARTKCPSIIVEPEFIHHVSAIKERAEAGQAAIANALMDFMLMTAMHESGE